MTERSRLSDMLRQIAVTVPDERIGPLLWFRDELLRWNRKINLTAITNPSEALEKHLVDSLALLPYMRDKCRMLDMGSGGGFPCIPVKIVRQDLLVWSVDAVSKKIAFQKHAGRHLNLQGFTAIHARLQDLPDYPGLPLFDQVVARAFAPIKEIVRLADPVLAPGGEIIAMKGPEGLEEQADSAETLLEAGFACHKIVQFRLPESGAQRMLLFLTRSAAR
ncbi:MAG: 16S rRNA (guanine(527)-N(7))-methyltransferase RsmG [Syntrophotaleaceae bacterium]